MAAFVFFTTAARTFFIPTNFSSRLPVYMFFFFALVAGTCIGMLTIPIGSDHSNTSYTKLRRYFFDERSRQYSTALNHMLTPACLSLMSTASGLSTTTMGISTSTFLAWVVTYLRSGKETSLLMSNASN